MQCKRDDHTDYCTRSKVRTVFDDVEVYSQSCKKVNTKQSGFMAYHKKNEDMQTSCIDDKECSQRSITQNHIG